MRSIVTTRRYGPKRTYRRHDATDGAIWLWRARLVTPWKSISPWTAFDEFGVTQVGSIPVGHLVPISVIWSQPTSQWTTQDADGHTQDAYHLEISADPSFSPLEYDSGEVESTNLYHVHTGLAAGLHYRRLKVRVNETDWSEWEQDRFTISAGTSQSALWELFRQHPDGIRSKIYVPISSVEGRRAWNDVGGFDFTIDNFKPFVERAWFAIHHFDEVSGAVAHDIFGKNDLDLSGSPAWTDGVLNLTGTEYGVSRDLAFNLSGDFTAYLVLYPSGTSGCIWFLGEDANDTNYYSVQYNGTGKIRIVVNGATSADLTVSATAWVLLRLKRVGTTLTLTNISATVPSDVTTTATATGVPKLAIGRYMGATPGSTVTSSKVAGHMLHSDDMTAAEDTREVLAYKSILRHRSIEL